MNKNTFFAMMLILGGFLFFTSDTYNKMYYKYILKKPFPENVVEKNTVDQKAPAADTVKKTADTLKPASPIAMSGSLLAAPDSIQKSGDTLWVETEDVVAGISEKGAKIISLQMKKFRRDHSKKSSGKNDTGGLVDLLPEKCQGGAGVRINAVSFDNTLFVPDSGDTSKRYTVKPGETKELCLTAYGENGTALRKKFIFSGTGYKIGLAVSSDQLQSNLLTLSWPDGIKESEKTQNGLYQTEERKSHYSDGEDVEHLQMKGDGKEQPSGSFRWVGVSSKYFFVSLVADTINNADISIIGYKEENKPDKDGKKDKLVRVNYSISYKYTPQSKETKLWIYAGPSEYEELKKFGLKFQKTLFPALGWWQPWILRADIWFPPICEFVLWLLLLLFKGVKDYGVAILLLTLLTKIATYPLTQSSMKSMNRMKDLAPKIAALKNKYKGNPRKLQEATMAMYKEEGVNPLNPGCLPIFLQMPIFISLFVVFQKAIELRGAESILLFWSHDLSKPEVLISLEKVFSGGIPIYGSHISLLPIIMAVIQYFQGKMTIKDPNQKMMIYFMPIFMLVIFNNFPSGLGLYWTVSSAIQLVQQIILDKKTQAKAVTESTIYQPIRGKKR